EFGDRRAPQLHVEDHALDDSCTDVDQLSKELTDRLSHEVLGQHQGRRDRPELVHKAEKLGVATARGGLCELVSPLGDDGEALRNRLLWGQFRVTDRKDDGY